MLVQGKIREDFFFRIHIIPIFLPPLRDRREDIPLMAEHFCRTYCEESERKHIPGYVMDTLCVYEWPGNVRELENVVQRYVTLGSIDFAGVSEKNNILGQQFLFDSEKEDFGLYSMLELFEKQYLSKILDQFNWKRGKASAYLKIPPRTLYRKIKKYHLADE